MTSEAGPKFSELHPNPSGRDVVPQTNDLTGLFTAFDLLREAGSKISPEPAGPATLPAVDIQPYAPPLEGTPPAEQ